MFQTSIVRSLAPSPREARRGRGLGRGVRECSQDTVKTPLSLPLSPLLRHEEREFFPADLVVGSRCIRSNSHYDGLASLGVHPLGCQTPPNTLKRGHQTRLESQNENCWCIRRFPAHWFLIIWILLGSLAAGQGREAAAPPGKPVPGADLFTNGAVLRLRIEIPKKEAAELRRSNRKDVPASVSEGDLIYEQVGVHLKGSTGSFRPLDDKPALTLDFGKFKPGQRFHGLRKIHLNNSVEDPSYLNELLGGELFRAAGVPAPRVNHALVELNGRKLGLYVVKEGFTEDFLGLYFRKTNGNLYEAGVGHDAGEPMKRVSGEGLDDQADLKALATAARQPDLDQRWARLDQILDMDRFITFMALEVMICHRDGYCLARNNFRIYHDLDTDKILFFPHGMDQLFGKSDAPLFPQMNGVVARAVMETPTGRQSYRRKVEFLLTNVFDVAVLAERADSTVKRLQPVLSAKEARTLEREAATVKERIARRRHDLDQQIKQPELAPLQFDNGIAHLAAWQAVDPPVGGTMIQQPASDGKMALRIGAGPVTSASWRAKVLLPAGRYRFEGTASTKGVEPLNFGKNKGARLRVIGVSGVQSANLLGNQDWKVLRVEFQVGAQQEVELVCELRARAGEVWFELGSLRLLRL